MLRPDCPLTPVSGVEKVWLISEANFLTIRKTLHKYVTHIVGCPLKWMPRVVEPISVHVMVTSKFLSDTVGACCTILHYSPIPSPPYHPIFGQGLA